MRFELKNFILFISDIGNDHINTYDSSSYTTEFKKNITSLVIYYSHINFDDQIDKLFAIIEDYPNITRLTFSGHNGKNVNVFINKFLELNILIKELEITCMTDIEINPDLLNRHPLKKFMIKYSSFLEKSNSLAKIIKNNTTITSLTVYFHENSKNDVVYQQFLDSLQEKKNIKELSISFNNSSKAKALGDFIAKNKSLVKLSINYSQWGCEGAFLVSLGIKENRTVKSYSIKGCVGESNRYTHIARHTLINILNSIIDSKSIIEFNFDDSHYGSSYNLDLIAEYLPKMEIDKLCISTVYNYSSEIFYQKLIDNLTIYEFEINFPRGIPLFVNDNRRSEERIKNKILKRNKRNYFWMKYYQLKNKNENNQKISSRIEMPNEIISTILEFIFELPILEIKKIMFEDSEV